MEKRGEIGEMEEERKGRGRKGGERERGEMGKEW